LKQNFSEEIFRKVEEKIGDVKTDLRDIICKTVNWLSVVRIVGAAMYSLVLQLKS
jgi:hypothetical protein